MRRMPGLSLRLLVAISLLAALHLAVFITLLVALGNLRAADSDARDSATVARAITGVQIALSELEAEERGALITHGSRQFLTTWRDSANELREHTDVLAIVARRPERAVVGRIRSYLADSASALADAEAGADPAITQRQLALGESERVVRAIDRELDAVLAQERAARTDRRESATGLAEIAQILGVVGIATTFVCAIGFLIYIRAAILKPLRGVADAARALAAGDLGARVAGHGGFGEVRELARTFDGMAASLEESRTALERQNAELAAQSAELAATARTAREAQRVKEDFFALVSHELRTPLTAIVGYLELVLSNDGAALPEEHAHHLAIVDRNAQRLLRLVGDLLFAAQVESGSLLLEPDAVDLPQLVRDAVELARPRAEDADVALTVEVAHVPACLGDRDRLAQVLDNLVSNALKFTPPGGRVAVRLSTRGDRALLEIEDTGVGVPAEEIPRLFERFYRAANATAGAVPGLGLGLMIARAIVEGHGGAIAIRSKIAVGTTFTVTLPLRTAPEEVAAAAGGYPAGGR